MPDSTAIPRPIVDAPRARRSCIPALHVPATDYAALERPAILRRADDRADRRTALAAHAIDLAVQLRGDDGPARHHRARNIVTAIALDASPITPDATRVGEATTTVHRALLDAHVEPSTAAHFASVVIDALVAGGFIR